MSFNRFFHLGRKKISCYHSNARKLFCRRTPRLFSSEARGFLSPLPLFVPYYFPVLPICICSLIWVFFLAVGVSPDGYKLITTYIRSFFFISRAIPATLTSCSSSTGMQLWYTLAYWDCSLLDRGRYPSPPLPPHSAN